MIQLDGKQKDPPIDATESCRSDILDLCICVFVNQAGDNFDFVKLSPNAISATESSNSYTPIASPTPLCLCTSTLSVISVSFCLHWGASPI